MKPVLVFCLLLAAVIAAPSAAAQTQGEMNAEAYRDYQKADDAMNKVYAQVIAKLDSEGQAKLRAAQRAWIVFRDAQAEVEADAMRGGTAAALLRAVSRTETTHQRTQQLKELLKSVKELSQ